MTTDTSIRLYASLINNSEKKNVLTKKQVKTIEKTVKSNLHKYTSTLSLTSSNKSIEPLIKKIKSGKSEIDKQLKQGKALQPGIINECITAQTLASILHLNNFFDFETEPVSKIPKEVKHNMDKIQNSSKTGCSARYAYYQKGNFDTIIFQYGNPATEEDLTVIINGQICSNEIKDLPALLTDADLEYDEDGKIIITDEIRKTFPYFIPCIEKFNSETTVFQEAGHNYPIESNVDPNEFFPLYTDSCLQSVDALLVSKDNQPIVLTKDMITTPCPDGQFVLSIKGSEIRTTGKNYKKVFTEEYLRKTLSDCGIGIDENGICHVEKTNPNVIGFVRGRGKTNYTRYKINHCFFVKNEENVLKDCGDHYEFAYNNILQIKCGISIHIQLNKSRDEINEAFGFCKSSVVA